MVLSYSEQASDGTATIVKRMRDTGHYSARNSSKGALVAEAGQVFAALQSGLALPEVRERALTGGVLSQRSRNTRRRIWALLHYRYLATRNDWLTAALQEACGIGPQSPEFISMLYLHYALRDRLTYDFVTGVLWQKWCEDLPFISRNDVLDVLDRASEEQPHILRWTENSRVKLAGSILTALRDFGLLKGTQKKVLIRPILPLLTAEHLLRILTLEGCRGRRVIEDGTWRLFLLSEQDVAATLTKLAQEGCIRFEKVGTTVVLETPEEWEVTT
jgi:hypothetical protein